MLSRFIPILILSISLVRGQQVLFFAKGLQPAVCIGKDGAIDMVFGKGSRFYYTASEDSGKTFSAPTPVDSLPGLHLGVSRGPQIASGAQSTVITAIDKLGNVYAYVLDHQTKKWQKQGRVNDVPETAQEGFNALAGDGKNTFFVLWLDLREDKNNKLYGSVSTDGGYSWSKNKLIYRSPDTTVCECCQPVVLMQDKRVYVQFRNQIDGARDMYVTVSEDSGETFRPAQKMGTGTWKLKACPMDGGSISVNKSGELTSVFRRENLLYTAKPGEPEQLLAPGKNASIVTSGQTSFIAWQDQGKILLKPSGKPTIQVGTGRFPKLLLLDNQRVFCVWEDKEEIKGMVVAVE